MTSPDPAGPPGLPRSGLRDIAFPAVPEETHARALALQFQFAQTERWPAEAIAVQQFRQLGELLRFAEQEIPFWRTRLRRAGLRPGQKLDARLFARLPVLSQLEARQAGERLRPGTLPQGHGRILADAAAGSPPFAPAGSELARFLRHAAPLRLALWHGLDWSAPLAIILPPGSPSAAMPEQPGWGNAYAAFATAQATRLAPGAPLAEQLAALERLRPGYLLTTPAHAATLAQACRQAGRRLPGLRAILTEGEAPGAAIRALCRDTLGAGIIAACGTPETGLLSLQCPQHAHHGHAHHVLAEAAYVEVLDERGRPCLPGQPGRLVATPLHNFAMPLLRYDTGLRAATGGACPCGRCLPVLCPVPAGETAASHVTTAAPAPDRRGFLPVSTVVPRSSQPGIAWPAIATGQAAKLLALQYQFCQSEYWPPAQLRARQFRQLEQLLAHSQRTMPFWRQRLNAAGFAPGMKLTEALWARIPILTRAEAQEAGTALHCLSVPAAHGEIFAASTSGSSGAPLSIAKTATHQLFWDANQLRDMLWHGVDLAGKLAVIRRDRQGDAGPGRGRDLPDWGPPLAGVYATGPATTYETRRPLSEQIAWLRREDPDYLQAYPSFLGLLAQHFRENGEKPPRLRGLFALSEVLTPETRALCRDVLGATVTESYSCEEAGYLALQCPLHDHLHALADTVLLEVLDESGLPCAPGQVGRVVITPLHNFAMPLLRYEIGDLAEPGPPCDCGRTLPVLRRVLGRSRSRVLLPSGEIRVAYFGGSGFNQIPDLRRFQVIQTARDAIELRLVVHRPLTPEVEAHIVRRIGEMLGHPFKTNVIYADDIPPSPSGKFEDFKSLIL